MGKELGMPSNGILRLYDQFPRCYRDINEMTEQLPEIAAMGFNAVWINPIQETGKLKHPLGRQDPLGLGENTPGYSGSLYAIKDIEKFDNDFSTDKTNNSKNNAKDISAIQCFTREAKNLGLTPIFDLVLNHVALDAEIYKQNKSWFIHPSVHFGPFCCDFNYRDATLRRAIIDFHKKEILKYIASYGFMGVRVDAAKHLEREVQQEIYDYIEQLCSEHYKVRLIIFVEVIPGKGKLENVIKRMQGMGITHVMNSLFKERFTVDFRRVDIADGRSYWEKGRLGGKDALYGLRLLREIATENKNNKPGMLLGGTIGFSGSHDELSLYDVALNDRAKFVITQENPNVEENEDFYRKVEQKKLGIKNLTVDQQNLFLKEKIAAVAFTSDAGWYLLSGDEFGHEGRKWVFDFYKPCASGNSFRNGWSRRFNLRSFIKGINDILSKLPKPNLEFWVQHVVLEAKPELMIVIRHNGEGFSRVAELVVVNLTEQLVDFLKEDIGQIAKLATLRCSDSKSQTEAINCVMRTINSTNQSQSSSSSSSSSTSSTSTTNFEPKIFCLGNIKVDESIKQYVTVARTDNFSAPAAEHSSTPPAAPTVGAIMSK